MVAPDTEFQRDWHSELEILVMLTFCRVLALDPEPGIKTCGKIIE
jgi:hypothetical protein